MAGGIRISFSGTKPIKRKGAKLQRKAQAVIGSTVNGKLRLVGLRQREEGDEILVRNLCEERIKRSSLGLGKNVNRHTTSVWTETLVLIYG
jgi:hypothetical protein